MKRRIVTAMTIATVLAGVGVRAQSKPALGDLLCEDGKIVLTTDEGAAWSAGFFNGVLITLQVLERKVDFDSEDSSGNVISARIHGYCVSHPKDQVQAAALIVTMRTLRVDGGKK